MRIPKRQSVIILSLWLGLAGLALAQEPNKPEPKAPSSLNLKPTSTTQTKLPEKLFSPSVSQLFYDTAHDIIHNKAISGASALTSEKATSQAEQAIVFLLAANELDASSGFVSVDLLTIASRPGLAGILPLLYYSLVKYVDKNADFLVATNAIKYLYQQLDTRQQKEILISRLLREMGNSNPAIKSELLTTMGLLFAEKSDDANATTAMAMAYNADKYNLLAFEKLAELVPEQISPVLNLQYFRLKLRENPLDLGTAIAFAQYAQRVQLYDIASGSYEYCADLFRFLNPGQDIPAGIYLDWMTSYYNVPRNRSMCLQLAEQFRKQGQFNLQIEAIAANAAEKTGETDLARQILNNAEQKALELIEKSNGPAGPVDYKALAWFYCFIKPDPNKAIDWANKAYSIEPNSPAAAALLACAFADNNEPNLAKPLVENFPQTQIAVFVQAKLQLADGKKQAALDLLRSAIDKDPGSIVAERALSLLTSQQSEYIPIFDTGLMLATLQNNIGEHVVPRFVRPDQMLSFQFSIRGMRFSYGNDITGTAAITNNWYEPLVISENGLCRGQIIVDADVTGDLRTRFEQLVSITTRPTTPIEPGKNAVVPVRLYCGPLKTLLANHPQAALTIKFTAYLDPVITKDGNIASSIPGIQPVTIDIERPREEITSDFLQNRFESLSKGKQGPKIKAAQLFAGLMMEIHEMESLPAGAPPPYKLVRVNWIPPMVKSGLIHSLGDSDWIVRVQALASITDLPLDYDLTAAAAQGLNDKNWPARMMALWLLAPKQGYNFTKVLDRTALYDESELVKNMAFALGGKVPELNKPIEEPLLDLLRQEPNIIGQSPLSPILSPGGPK